MVAYLFKGISPPSPSMFNNPAFSLMQTTAASSSGLLSSLAMDLTAGKNLADLNSAMVLTNILSKLRIGSKHTYTLIKVVGPCLILAAGAYEFAKRLTFIPNFLGFIGSKLVGCVTASIVVPKDSPLNTDICCWIGVHGSGKSAKCLTLSDMRGPISEEEDEDDEESFADQKTKKPLRYIPSFGLSYFTYEGYRMTLERKEATVVQDEDGKITQIEAGECDPEKLRNLTLTVFPTFRGTEPIKKFLAHVQGFSSPPRERVTEIYRPLSQSDRGDHHYWDVYYRPARDIKGIVMESTKKDSLLSDINFYLSDACRKFYGNRGIPYRRGYLFYGPPGTGKTSFATALSGHFNLPLYILNLADMNDHTLISLFQRLPKRCILLLEDIDSAGLDREYKVEEPISNDEDDFKPKTKIKRCVTLSCLLNELDGPLSPEGRILCMTSNSPDSLDAALVRPGRCDRKILFGYVSAEVSAGLYTNIYTKTGDELYRDETNAADEHDIPAMAAHFALKIPVNAAITPAECQAWLLANRLDPVAAVDGAEQWAREIIENKLRGANVASFTNEIKSVPGFRRFDTPPTSPTPSVA